MLTTEQSSKYTNISAPALYTHNDSLTHSLSLSHTHTHKSHKGQRTVQHRHFKKSVIVNLLSIHSQLVKVLYIRPEYEGQSYTTSLSVRRSWIIVTECSVYIVYLTALSAAQTICHQTVRWIMECGRCRKKWIWLMELSRHLSGWIKNNHKVLSWEGQARTWIQTCDFQNTKRVWWPPNRNA
jgi:hypothetical protein